MTQSWKPFPRDILEKSLMELPVPHYDDGEGEEDENTHERLRDYPDDDSEDGDD